MRRSDFGLLLGTRVVRAFGFGFSTVLFAVHLQARHLSATEIGIFLAIGLLAASWAGLLAAAAASKFGRRNTLAATGLLMALCGFDLSFAVQPFLLSLAGLTGMMGIAGTDLGPFLAVEQAVLTQTSDGRGRNRAFAQYSVTGAVAGAAGGFASAFGTTLARTQLFFGLFGVLGLATAAIPLLLSPAVEGPPNERTFGSLRPLAGLLTLFFLDALGGGLVVNGVTAYWLHVKFGASPAVLGPSFAVMSLLTAVSQGFAGRLADRIGLINTMVYTHLPSSLLLILVPFMPGLYWAVGILIVRSSIASMDVPARQAYLVSIVKPNERSGAIAVSGAVRGMAAAAGPVITGAAIQAAALGLPFVLGGVIKSLYDLGLYIGFRRRFGDHENILR